MTALALRKYFVASAFLLAAYFLLPVSLYVGERDIPQTLKRADFNSDGKVNLVDFSILLFNWNTADTGTDLNSDGRVNLTDFSILLFNWTG